MTPISDAMTPRLRLPLIEGGQSLKHITHNEALLDVDTLLFTVLESLSATTPPAGEGQICVIVGAGAVDEFIGHEGKLACCVDGAWRYYAPQAGHTAWLTEDNTYRVFHDGEWVVAGAIPGEPDDGTGPVAFFGIGTQADTYNRLAVKSPSALFTHDDQVASPTGDIRFTLNRAGVNNTATFNFQTSYQGTAEFGLSGDADFRIKISPDGGNFTTALRVATADGKVGIGERGPLHALDVNRTDDGQTTRAAVSNTSAAPGSGAGVSLHAGGSQTTALVQDADGQARLDTTGPTFSYTSSDPNGSHVFMAGTVEVVRFQASSVECNVPLKLAEVAVANLPTPQRGMMVYVTDDAQGAGPAYADGTQWLRMSDRQAVT